MKSTRGALRRGSTWSGNRPLTTWLSLHGHDTTKPPTIARRLLLLVPTKRLPVASSSSTNKPLATARRLLLLMPGRRLLAANSSLTNKRRLDENTPPASLQSVLPRTTRLVYSLPNPSLPGASTRTAVRPNVEPNENRRPPEPSSCGFDAAASTSGSPARLCGAYNVRPTSHACGT